MHVDDLKTRLRQLPSLAMVKSDTIDFLAKYSELVTAPGDTDLTPQLQDGNHYLFLVDGSLAIIEGDHVVTRFGPSDPIAQHHLAKTHSGQYRLKATSNIAYIRINKREFDMSQNWQQGSDYEVKDLAEADAPDGDWMARLLSKPMFYKIPSNNLQAMFARFKPIKLGAGEVVVSQGEPGDHFYVLASGTCQVIRQFSAELRPLMVAELKPGDCFGEESLITNSPRNATIKMTSAGVIMRLGKPDFLTLLNEPLTHWIQYTEAAKLIQERRVGLIDVRLPDEYGQRRIKQSINLPLPMLRLKIGALDRKLPYIVYCDAGQRSRAAAFILEQYGIDTHVLKGGLQGIPRRS